MDGEADIAIVLHEPIEIDLSQHEQPAIGHGDDVGLPRHAGEQRHLAEQVAAAERDAATGKDDLGRAGGDEVAARPPGRPCARSARAARRNGASAASEPARAAGR